MKRPDSPARPALSELEHQVMQAVWASGPSTVDAVHQVVSQRRDLKEVTIRTVLRRLEQKGYLQHDIDGRAYIYRAVDAPRNVAARAIRHILDRFCQGSVEELISGLVESDVLTAAELDRLEATIKARARTRTVKSAKNGRHDGPPR
jgi:BlaI family transcriptional regulator, penicillinase repressor